MAPETDSADPAPETSPEELLAPLEAVLFGTPEPLTLKMMSKIFGEEVPTSDLRAALQILKESTAADGRGILLEEIAGGWQFLTRAEYGAYLDRMGRTQKRERLSPAALETLAVVAWKQPATRAEVDAIRGVACGPLLRTLMDLKLLKVTGRASIPGAPFQYGTTRRFLQHFGLKSAKDLPSPKEVARLLAERDSA
jgi:segregation and condensation protein B